MIPLDCLPLVTSRNATGACLPPRRSAATRCDTDCHTVTRGGEIFFEPVGQCTILTRTTIGTPGRRLGGVGVPSVASRGERLDVITEFDRADAARLDDRLARANSRSDGEWLLR